MATTMKKRGSSKHRGIAISFLETPLGPAQRTLVRARIDRAALPKAAKSFLKKLMHVLPELSNAHFNILIKDIPKIAVKGNLNERVSLDQYLADFRKHFSKPLKPASAGEWEVIRRYVAEHPYLTRAEKRQVLRELNSRKQLSAEELHKSVHYFTVCKVMDLIVARETK